MTAVIHQVHKSSNHSKLHKACCSKPTQHWKSTRRSTIDRI